MRLVFVVVVALLLAAQAQDAPAPAPADAAGSQPPAPAAPTSDSSSAADTVTPQPPSNDTPAPPSTETQTQSEVDDLYRLYETVLARSREMADKERDNIKQFANEAIERIRKMKFETENKVQTTEAAQAAAAPAADTATANTAPAVEAAANSAPASFLEVQTPDVLDTALLQLEVELHKLAGKRRQPPAPTAPEAAPASVTAAEAPAAAPVEAAPQAAPEVPPAASITEEGSATGERKKRRRRRRRNGGGLVIQPAPDQPDKAISIRNRDDLGAAHAMAKDVAGQHSWVENLSALLSEVDSSEGKSKALKLRLVEKENFLDSLDKRRQLIAADIKTDKDSLQMLQAHVKALTARVERLKKERVKAELTSQQHQYDAAAQKLAGEVDNIKSVVQALQSRITSINEESKPLYTEEMQNMRASLQVQDGGAAVATAEDEQAAPAAFVEMTRLRGGAQ